MSRKLRPQTPNFFGVFSFSLFDRCDSDKPEKINISLISYGFLFPPKIKVDHNIRLDSLTINLGNINIIFHSLTLCFVSKSLTLWTSIFKVTVQRSTLSVNFHVNMSTMILTHGLCLNLPSRMLSYQRRTNPAKIQLEKELDFGYLLSMKCSTYESNLCGVEGLISGRSGKILQCTF